MKKAFKPVLFITVGILLGIGVPYGFKLFANPSNTAGYRDLEMKVDVAGHDLMIWKTVIAPQQEHTPGIALHRHEYARILIPLTEGVLQRRDADGRTTDYVLNRGKPLYLPEDTQNGFHTDENLGKAPIEVMVIQFTQAPVRVDELTAADLKKVLSTSSTHTLALDNTTVATY